MNKTTEIKDASEVRDKSRNISAKEWERKSQVDEGVWRKCRKQGVSLSVRRVV